MPPVLPAKSCCCPLLDEVKIFTLEVFKTFRLKWPYKFLQLLFLLSTSIAFSLGRIVSSINTCSIIFKSRSTYKLQKRRKISLNSFMRNVELVWLFSNENVQESKMYVQVIDMVTCSGKICVQVKFILR